MAHASRRRDHRLAKAVLRFGRGLALLTLVSPISGCFSISYVDRDNRLHRTGLMDIVVAEDATKSVQATRVTILGLAISHDPVNGGGLTIGYRDDRLLALPDNSCVDLKASAVCAEAAKPKGSVP
ncbi:hypothetical protein [Caulobacter sp. BP25]|uniref:hypothetical protein n=1 Tax=Caulobacter sp. BP25 TaxID=2048900 RepID=UPI000C12E015|nr:hypothetical protein [Caulobacter sp. BP25]PHY21746.1 hypothetical protein CSW59_03525 [Caulobacter sp. BP25]